ncbi:ATP-binding protein [Chitinophaga oryziterrae]|uniref:ATP-binding protein n=1 Tax=Chitinophaga oryziterrae TaxID=1031224 RepID=A0A6N8JAY3_9BACT|nr:ATP-binding protein [Chitinophaga oryziterrae]MVT41476.1 ATP-binding protein [Chitinophaga oryziterrae]
MHTESCTPNPEFLIKSIAEQGYTLETSIADLIDNSITATAELVEVLIDTQKTPLALFIADDGIGMSYEELKKNMQFPSGSPEDSRETNDLGRFGLGLKTASFAQTRCFTVISKKRGETKFNARTWDVNHLKKGHWEVLINSEEEIDFFLNTYYNLSKVFLKPFSNYQPNTIIVWHGLYKFENGTGENPGSEVLQKELTRTVKEHLQLTFHRFMERDKPLQIRLNNEHLIPFNPFPVSARQISTKQKVLFGNRLKLEGYVLPNSSISESKGISGWTLTDKSLMDMEGMYIYRSDRIIVFGGWNGVIRKSPLLQLARLKVEIGNGIDHLFHLNVAKSSITIPFSERRGFIRYVSELKAEAEKEFFNYEVRRSAVKSQVKMIFKKIPTSHGMAMVIDKDFTLLKSLTDTLTEQQNKQLKIILRMITTTVNKIKKVHTDENYVSLVEKEGIQEVDIKEAIMQLLADRISKENILNDILPAMGIDINTLSASILSLLQ